MSEDNVSSLAIASQSTLSPRAASCHAHPDTHSGSPIELPLPGWINRGY